MLYDTFFNYSRLCHCLHSFKFLQQSTAWILLLHGSYWQHYLSLKSLLFILISQCRVLGLKDIFPLPFADSKGRWCLTSGSVISGSGGERSCSMMEVIILSWSGLYPSLPSHPEHCMVLPSSFACPHGYHLPWLWRLDICPSVPMSPSTLAPVLLPPHIPPISPLFFFLILQLLQPMTLSLFLHKYAKFPSLFPCCTGTHSKSFLTSAKGNSTCLLFGDQAHKDFYGSELEHVWPRWDF